jgi:hypothetical protein
MPASKRALEGVLGAGRMEHEPNQHQGLLLISAGVQSRCFFSGIWTPDNSLAVASSSI